MIRPYQKDMLDAIEEKFREHSSTLLVASTGTGKSVVFSHLIARRKHMGRALVFAHRKELIDQAANHIHAITGLPVGIEMAEQYASDRLFGEEPVVVACIDSMDSGRRIERFNPTKFSTLIVDEAHRAVGDRYKRVLSHFRDGNPNLKILGVTATPDCHDEEALGQIFQSVAFAYDLLDAVMDGWLVRPICRTVKLDGLDLSDVRTVAGELNAGQLAELLGANQDLEAIAAATIQHSGDRSTIVFADSVTESDTEEIGGEIVRTYREGNAPKLTEMLNGHKAGSARLVHGGTPKDERKTIVEDFRAGRFQYVVNVGVFTEGADFPDTGCIVLARPTKSRALASQMIGRGTRPHSTIANYLGTLANDVERRNAIAESVKPSCLLLDFVDNTNRHDLIHPANILGGRVSDKAQKIVTDACQGMPVDLIAELEKVELGIRENEELQRAKSRAGVKAKQRSADRDPFAIYGLQRRERRGWEPVAPLDDTQRSKLERWGIKGIDKLDFSGAQQIIEEYQRRARNGLCTLKQANQLKRFGYDGEISYEQAHEIMNKIASNGWKR